MGFVLTQQGIFLRIFYLCALLILVGWIWAFISVRGLSFHRSAPVTRMQLGDVFEEQYEIANQLRIGRAHVEIIDQSGLIDHTGSRVLTRLGGKEIRLYSAYTTLKKRGEFTLGPTLLTSGDPFGLFRAQRVFRSHHTLVVLPFFVVLRQFPFPPGLLPGGKAIRRRSHDVTPHASGIREYETGDSLNRIHWLSSARKERLMSKEFEQDPKADVWVILDAEKSTHITSVDEESGDPISDRLWLWKRRSAFSLPPSTFEYAVSVAASIANYFIKQEQAVGLSCVGQKPLVIAAERGVRQLDKILDTLALIQCQGNLSIQGVIQSQGNQIPRGSTVILVSASVKKTLLLAANILLFRKMKPVVVLIDPRSFGSDISVEEEIVPGLKQQKIHFSVITKGDDIKQVLERTF